MFRLCRKSYGRRRKDNKVVHMISQEAIDLFIDVLAQVRNGNNADPGSVDEVAHALSNRLERDYNGFDSDKVFDQYVVAYGMKDEPTTRKQMLKVLFADD